MILIIILNDGLLTDDRLKPYEDKIHYFAANRQDIISQACLLWNVLNHLIRHSKETRPDWYFIRFEDISKEPITYFRKLYEFVNLNCDTNIERKIRAHTLESKRKNAVKSFSARNSKKNLDTWQERLTNKEVNKILVSCEDLITYFYPEQQ